MYFDILRERCYFIDRPAHKNNLASMKNRASCSSKTNQLDELPWKNNNARRSSREFQLIVETIVPMKVSTRNKGRTETKSGRLMNRGRTSTKTSRNDASIDLARAMCLIESCRSVWSLIEPTRDSAIVDSINQQLAQ